MESYYRCKLIDYYDANNVLVEISFLEVTIKRRFRLYNVTMPSRRSKDPHTKRLGDECVVEMRKKIQEGSICWCQIKGRKEYLELFFNGFSLNKYMVDKGFSSMRLSHQ